MERIPFRSFKIISPKPPIKRVHALSEVIDRYCLSAYELTLNNRDIIEIDSIPHAYLQVTKLYLSHNLLSSLTGIDQFTHLTHLSISHNSIISISELLKLKNSENLLVLSIKGNPCALHPNVLGNILAIFPRLVELDGEPINDHVKQDLSDGFSLSKQLVEYIYKNELILIEKDIEIKRLKIKFELFRKLKERRNEFKGPYWEDVNAIQSRELRKMQEFPKLPSYRHYKKIRPYMIQNVIEVSSPALHHGVKVSYDHSEFLRIYKWLFCEILLQMHEYGNTDLQVWLQSQTSSFITSSDPESHFQMQLRIFSLLAPNCGDNSQRTQHQGVFPDIRMSAAVKKETLYDYLKPIDARDVLEVNFWNRKDLSVFPILGMSGDYLRALLSIIEGQLRSIEKLETEKTDLLRVDTSILGLPSLCDAKEIEEQNKSELSFGISWKESKQTLNMKDVHSNPFKTDRYGEELSTQMYPSSVTINTESPDLLHNYVNLTSPDLGSSSEQFLAKAKSLNITSSEPLSIFTPEKSQEIPEVSATFEETMIKKDENETQSSTIKKFSYEPSQSPNVLIQESYMEEVLLNPFLRTLRFAFNIWKKAEINLKNKKVKNLLSNPYNVEKLNKVFGKGNGMNDSINSEFKKTEKFTSEEKKQRSGLDQKLNKIKALSYRNGRLKLDSFFLWKHFLLTKKRNRLRTYKELINSTVSKENLRTLIKQPITEQQESKQSYSRSSSNKPKEKQIPKTYNRSSSNKSKEKLITDINNLLKNINCSDSKLQQIWHKIRSSRPLSPFTKTLRMPSHCEICTKDKAQRLSKQIKSVAKDLRSTLSSCKICKHSK